MPTKKITAVPTIYDVAELSGVSTATVSRVLNDRKNMVTEETRKRVLQAVQELRFKPNMNARGLVNNQTKLIEIFFHNHKYPVGFKSEWFSDVMVGAASILQNEGYGILINFLIGLPGTAGVVEQAFRNNVDGILMIAPSLEEKDLLAITQRATPVVLVGHRTQSTTFTFVDSNNIEASEMTVKHLVQLGHRKIACLAGPVDNVQNAKDRLFGFKKAMKEAGLPVPKTYVVTSDSYTQVNGVVGMQQLLRLNDRPTAVYCTGDTLAMGAWDALQEAGIEIGKEISITGYDDVPMVSQSPYSITTIKQDVQALSAVGARLLISKIKDPDLEPVQYFQKTELVVRKSSGPRQ